MAETSTWTSKQSWESVYRQHGDRLWRALYAYAGDREVASDATSEAFAQAMARGDAIRSRENWIWKAAFRIAAGQLKSRRRSLPLKREESYEMKTSGPEIIEALKKLTPMQRGSMVLFYFVDLPVKEIARILRSTTPSIRVHLSQGRKKMRQLLEVTDV